MREIKTNLAALRQGRGVSAVLLAKAAGVSRQTIYAIEAGTFVPNTAVALKLARELNTSVEELFALIGAPAESNPRTERVRMLPGTPLSSAGQQVQLCKVNGRLIASPSSTVPVYLPASDGVTTGEAQVQMFDAATDYSNRILFAGCDPGMSVLSRRARASGVELVLAHRNSSQALELLKAGCIHIAGTHLSDQSAAISRLFPRNSVAVVSFAVWEEGMVTAPGNPKSIAGPEDLPRKDVAIVNREPGSGSRALLDSQLKQAGIETRQVRGYSELASGHLSAAWQVHAGAADCCIATRASARAFGLHFTPWATERYDLVIRKKHLDLPRMQSLLDTLSRSDLRRELEGLGGYDTRATGQRVL